jgi:hypothetical protein
MFLKRKDNDARKEAETAQDFREVWGVKELLRSAG